MAIPFQGHCIDTAEIPCLIVYLHYSLTLVTLLTIGSRIWTWLFTGITKSNTESSDMPYKYEFLYWVLFVSLSFYRYLIFIFIYIVYRAKNLQGKKPGEYAFVIKYVDSTRSRWVVILAGLYICTWGGVCGRTYFCLIYVVRLRVFFILKAIRHKLELLVECLNVPQTEKCGLLFYCFIFANYSHTGSVYKTLKYVL